MFSFLKRLLKVADSANSAENSLLHSVVDSEDSEDFPENPILLQVSKTYLNVFKLTFSSLSAFYFAF